MASLRLGGVERKPHRSLALTSRPDHVPIGRDHISAPILVRAISANPNNNSATKLVPNRQVVKWYR